MKYLTLAVLAAIFLMTTNACCTKKYCIGNGDIYEISFYNFHESDLDTITIINSSKNTNFTSNLDSTITKATSMGTYFAVFTYNKLDPDRDYKIKLNSTGQEYILSDFEFGKQGCNSCFPYRPKSDYFKVLKSYKVNGLVMSTFHVEIYK